MILADKWGKPMFEIRPDIFPEGFLTNDEMALWSLFEDCRQGAIDNG